MVSFSGSQEQPPLFNIITSSFEFSTKTLAPQQRERKKERERKKIKMTLQRAFSMCREGGRHMAFATNV
jgi:hypothetical protein